MLWAGIAVLGPAQATGQACAGSPLRAEGVAISFGMNGLELLRTARDGTGATEVEVALLGQFPARIWAGAELGYRRLDGLNNDATRLAGRVGYALPLRADVLTVCPMVLFEYEADDMVGEPETLPVDRSSRSLAGVGIGRRLPLGERATLVPSVAALGGRYSSRSRGQGGWLRGDAAGVAYLELGAVLEYRRIFLLQRTRLVAGGDAMDSSAWIGLGLAF